MDMQVLSTTTLQTLRSSEIIIHLSRCLLDKRYASLKSGLHVPYNCHSAERNNHTKEVTVVIYWPMNKCRLLCSGFEEITQNGTSVWLNRKPDLKWLINLGLFQKKFWGGRAADFIFTPTPQN